MLVLPSVTDKAKRELETIADHVIPAEQLEYPYEGKVKFEVGINKQCRYSKLHLWAQTRFKRLVYLDVDTAVQKASLIVFRLGYSTSRLTHLRWLLFRTSITCSRNLQFSLVSAISATFTTLAVCLEAHLTLLSRLPSDFFSLALSPYFDALRGRLPRHA